MNSCNPYFITIGRRLGVETFFKYFEAFGFTEKTGVDLGAEALPKAGVNYHSLEKMSPVNLASSSFGQSFQATPIQVLNAINAVVNDGKLMQPYIVAKTLDADGNVISETEPKVKRQVISESTSDLIIASMEQVSTKGTAKNSYVAGYRVAGKTGTSDVLGPTGATGEYIASFAGCAPANDPEISIIIVVNEPQGQTGGGAVAAPVAAEVIEKTLTYLNINRQYTDSEKDKLDKQVPNLAGKTVTEARAVLKEAGLKLKVVGSGDTVISQTPAYSQFVPVGGVVVVYTQENAEKTKVTVPDFTGMSVSQVNYEAVNRGINVKISGNSLSASGLTAYRQSIPADTEVEGGSTVTVYFRTTAGVSDH
jgi:stage V sporulation protein D (sporulation-specific penicillin-binding protein)